MYRVYSQSARTTAVAALSSAVVHEYPVDLVRTSLDIVTIPSPYLLSIVRVACEVDDVNLFTPKLRIYD